MKGLFRVCVCIVWFMINLPTPAAAADPYVATATLLTNPISPNVTGTTPSTFVVGTITFTQKPGENTVSIEGRLQVDQNFDLTNLSIGFHIHQTSDFSNGCVSAGLHYNPENKTHGGPSDSVRHVGDLGNVLFDKTSKIATVSTSDSMISLTGKYSVVGRSLVLHTKTDDLGRSEGSQIERDESKKTGNAGGRYACGPIVLKSDFSPSSAMSLISSQHILIGCLMGLFSIALQKLQW